MKDECRITLYDVSEAKEMKAALWLTWRELTNRKLSFTIGVVMIALAVALLVATELVSRARESAVMAKVDNIGPAFRLIPAGFNSTDLAKFEIGMNLISKSSIESLEQQLAPWIRVMKKRLLLKEDLGDLIIPVMGVEKSETVSFPDAPYGSSENDIDLGVLLAKRLGKSPDDKLQLMGNSFNIAHILPVTGSEEDIAAFLPLGRLQTLVGIPDAVNEVQLFPKSGVELDGVEALLKSNYPEVRVIRSDRGNVAEHEVSDSLRQYRWILYVSIAVVVAFCLFIWSYLNAKERWRELALLVSVGGTGITLCVILMQRAAIIGLLGSLCGYAVGSLFALLQDFSNASELVYSWKLLLTVVGGSIGISVVAAAPMSVISMCREHVKELQE